MHCHPINLGGAFFLVTCSPQLFLYTCHLNKHPRWQMYHVYAWVKVINSWCVFMCYLQRCLCRAMNFSFVFASNPALKNHVWNLPTSYPYDLFTSLCTVGHRVEHHCPGLSAQLTHVLCFNWWVVCRGGLYAWKYNTSKFTVSCTLLSQLVNKMVCYLLLASPFHQSD